MVDASIQVNEFGKFRIFFLFPSFIMIPKVILKKIWFIVSCHIIGFQLSLRKVHTNVAQF